jgi:hypothetical protein
MDGDIDFFINTWLRAGCPKARKQSVSGDWRECFFYMFHVEHRKRGKLNAERSGILWLAFLILSND